MEGGIEDRKLRPNRKRSYRQFFSLRSGTEGSVECVTKALQQTILPTPTSLPPGTKVDGKIDELKYKETSGAGWALSSFRSPNIDNNKVLKSLGENKSRKSEKENCLDQNLGREDKPYKSNCIKKNAYLTSDMVSLRELNKTISWSIRCQPFLPSPNANVDKEQLKCIIKQINPATIFLAESLKSLLDLEAKYEVDVELQSQLNPKFGFQEYLSVLNMIIIKSLKCYSACRETVYIAINLLDRYTGLRRSPSLDYMGTIALTCSLVAIKINEEVDPNIDTMIKAVGNAKGFSKISKVAVLACEKRLVAALDWNLSPPTPHAVGFAILDTFPLVLSFQLKLHFVSAIESIIMQYLTHITSRKVRRVSQIVAGALYVVLKECLGYGEFWRKTIEARIPEIQFTHPLFLNLCSELESFYIKLFINS